ncbi:DNA replication/repair protein RecF [candidate division KSB1 bacterium]|nr:DNA replication/repair protein RecF [candidate division KSB1 bacterium]
MRINRLAIKEFRNLNEWEHRFTSSHIYILGENGQGKTNLIESIYLLCLAKSFRTRDDNELIPFEQPFFRVEGDFVDFSGSSQNVVVYCGEAEGKKILLNGKPLIPFSKLVGLFPIVVLSADDQAITQGTPAIRRRFVNILLSQSSRRYLDDLKDYEKILKQRNMLLSHIAAGENRQARQLDAWNERLVDRGVAVMAARENLIEEINGYLFSAYSFLSAQKERLSLIYDPSVPSERDRSVKESFFRRLHRFAAKEKKKGQSLVGPHRDEFIFQIGDRNLRRYGSRGEHKSVLVSLKSAEAKLLQNKTSTQPLLLLDDLFAELDQARGKRAVELFEKESQTFITGTSFDYIAMKSELLERSDIELLFVNQGKVKKQT